MNYLNRPGLVSGRFFEYIGGASSRKCAYAGCGLEETEKPTVLILNRQ